MFNALLGNFIRVNLSNFVRKLIFFLCSILCDCIACCSPLPSLRKKNTWITN